MRKVERFVMYRCNVRGDSSGFTLLELMIVLVLSLILMAAVYLATQSTRQTNNEQQQIMALQQDLRAVMDILEKDIHNCGCAPLLAGNPLGTKFGITDAGAQSLTFTADLNANGVVDDETERITYAVSDGEIARITYRCPTAGDQSCRVPVQITRRALSLAFAYYDANSAATSLPAEIRSVEVSVKMRSSNGQFERQISRRIQFRNAEF
jgi:prepilin-type N-terminal cleavage/methylation domain-containing protein